MTLTRFIKKLKSESGTPSMGYAAPRATSFNAQNVKVSFDKLAEVIDKYHFTASQIWNVNEAGVSTVLKPNKIVADKGKRNVGAMTSEERGTNVTMVAAVLASGNTVAPISRICPAGKEPTGPAVMHAREPDSATDSTNQAKEEANTSYK
ncbi:hypothetical protein ILUMI_09898 [Ignelater luminosus]|uniref:Uncharacterized protein n=1 Tax=Ignelater luminosus TaxID=2038154 RepID=A0A8K0D316_IGNLU|nr:hypothetical protein ILUMI_09898 [Ignelater luminosus]